MFSATDSAADDVMTGALFAGGGLELLPPPEHADAVNAIIATAAVRRRIGELPVRKADIGYAMLSEVSMSFMTVY